MILKRVLASAGLGCTLLVPTSIAVNADVASAAATTSGHCSPVTGVQWVLPYAPHTKPLRERSVLRAQAGEREGARQAGGTYPGWPFGLALHGLSEQDWARLHRRVRKEQAQHQRCVLRMDSRLTTHAGWVTTERANRRGTTALRT